MKEKEFEIPPSTREQAAEALRMLRKVSGEPEPRELPGMLGLWDQEIRRLEREQRRRRDPETRRRLDIVQKARALRGDLTALEKERKGVKDDVDAQDLLDATEAFIGVEEFTQRAAYRMHIEDPEKAKEETTPADYEPPRRLYEPLRMWSKAIGDAAASGASQEEREAALRRRDAALRETQIQSFRELAKSRRRWHQTHDPEFSKLSARDQTVLVKSEAAESVGRVLAESKNLATHIEEELRNLTRGG